ncbi:MAG: DUF6266 family protein [Odoribacter sp.]
MGTLLPSSPLYGCSGRVGDFILYTVGGKTFFRYGPQKIGNPRTEKQCLQRGRISAAQTLFRSVKCCILYDVENRAARLQGKRSGYHLYLSRNTRAFGKGEYVDYSQLTFTEGVLQLPYDLRMQMTAKDTAVFSWLDNSGQTTANADDRLMMAAVFPDEPFRVEMLTSIRAVRGDGGAVIALPQRGEKVHLYCFFASADGTAFSADRYFCTTGVADGVH